jgi:hypothetical protein
MLKTLAPRGESEWLVRVSFQLFHLAEAAFPHRGELERFKTRQMMLVDKLRECRDAQLELDRLIDQHTKEIESGEAAIINTGRIQVTKDGSVAIRKAVQRTG